MNPLRPFACALAFALLAPLVACGSDDGGTTSGGTTSGGTTSGGTGGGISQENQACGVALENRTCATGLKCAQQSTNPKDLICMQSGLKAFGESCTPGGNDCFALMVCSQGVCTSSCDPSASVAECTDGFVCCGTGVGSCRKSCN